MDREIRLKKQSNLKTLKNMLVKPSEFRKLDVENKACISFNYTKYAAFDNWSIALNIINNLPEGNNLCNELILDSHKVKPYFDIEYIEQDFPALMREIVKIKVVKALQDIFNEKYSYTLQPCDIYFSSCHRPYQNKNKVSYHVVISTHEPTFVFENANKASFLAFELQNRIAIEPELGPEYTKIVDTSIYSKTQNFRLVGHCKSAELSFPFKLENSNKIEETIVTKIDDYPSNIRLIQVPEQHDNLYKNTKNIAVSTEDFSDEILKKVCDIHPTAEFVSFDPIDGFYQFNYVDRKEPCFCGAELGQVILHEQIGFFAYVYNDMVYVGCHSGRCVDSENKKIKKVIGSVNIKPVEVFEQVDFSNDFDLDPVFVLKCVSNDALGISDLFVNMYLNPKRIKWVNETKNGSTYFWNGKLWQEDDYSFVERLLVTTTVRVIRKSINLMKSNPEVQTDELEETIDKANKMITKLNSGTIINNILRFVKPLTRDLEFSKIKDIHTNFLSCKNGMLNLKSAELRDAIPADNITKCIDTEYNAKADYTDFENFVRQITSSQEGPNEELYFFLKWCIGYAMQGNPRKKMFIILFGPHGFNGKSLLMNTISDVLEYYAVSMDKSVVLEGPKKTAGSHSTEICQLENCRLGILSDTNEDASIDDGQMKQLTGITDKLSVREIFGKQREFTPVFVPFISTNHPIKINLTDKAMYERLVLIPFVLSFVDNPTKPYERKNDPTLAEKFRQNKQGILRWLVEASVYYTNHQNMSIPKCVNDAKDIYNKQVNPYLDFIDKNFKVTDDENDKIKRTEFLSLYKDYLRENNIKYIAKISEREFDKILKNIKYKNCKYYTGIVYIDEDAEEYEQEDNL
jgi:P4 family phage/plasmid primase-like protien